MNLVPFCRHKVHPGALVCLIGTDGFMPPLGAVGEVLAFHSEEPEGKVWQVLFPKHPCPNPPETWWFALEQWLMVIDPFAGVFEEENLLVVDSFSQIENAKSLDFLV